MGSGLDGMAVDRALAALRIARRRGRSIALDQKMASWGLLPAQVAATLLDRRISTLYQAHKRGRIKLVCVEGFWFVHRTELEAYAATPVKMGRPRKGVTDAT